jgi:hypothetical protein
MKEKCQSKKDAKNGSASSDDFWTIILLTIILFGQMKKIKLSSYIFICCVY